MGSCFKFVKPLGRLFVTRATSCPAGYKRVCRQELPAPLQQAALRKVWCYPVQCALPAPRAPLVDHFLDRDQALLRYLGETQVINAAYLQKLVLMTDQAFTRLAKFNNSVLNILRPEPSHERKANEKKNDD